MPSNGEPRIPRKELPSVCYQMVFNVAVSLDLLKQFGSYVPGKKIRWTLKDFQLFRMELSDYLALYISLPDLMCFSNFTNKVEQWIRLQPTAVVSDYRIWNIYMSKPSSTIAFNFLVAAFSKRRLAAEERKAALERKEFRESQRILNPLSVPSPSSSLLLIESKAISAIDNIWSENRKRLIEETLSDSDSDVFIIPPPIVTPVATNGRIFKLSKSVSFSAPILTPDGVADISTDFDDYDDIDFTSPLYKRNIKRASKLCPIPVSFLIDDSDDDMTIPFRCLIQHQLWYLSGMEISFTFVLLICNSPMVEFPANVDFMHLICH